MDLFEDVQLALSVKHDVFEVPEFLSLLFIKLGQPVVEVFVLVDLVDDGLAELDHQLAHLGGQVEPEDIKALKILAETSSKCLTLVLSLGRLLHQHLRCKPRASWRFRFSWPRSGRAVICSGGLQLFFGVSATNVIKRCSF